MKQKLIFEERVFTYQIDFVGHVNNIVYVQWLENGRVHLLEAIGMPAHEIAESKGIVPILTHTSIQYKRPFFLNNRVVVEVWISRLNHASAIMEFRFLNERNELCATAQQKGLFINRLTMKPARLSEELRQAFEKYLIPE
ncbi:MAG: thioesterase family protein [Mariniphaga sp.]|nr:thioesterase family protein [Mariniphaga sp.]MDD4226557.1 thioesterase family protein [Mariniphaga sp.]MDD4425145.1 thioesterase family protein [Mariniphaga sp.]